MQFKIQLITQCETGEAIQELAYLERETEGLEEIGITLVEAKALLATLQRQLVEQQIAAYLAARQRCPQCAQVFRHKDRHPLIFRTLFGNLYLPTPRDPYVQPSYHSVYGAMFTRAVVSGDEMGVIGFF
jgi:hypothetical protein